jgi:hypothetical protein
MQRRFTEPAQQKPAGHWPLAWQSTHLSPLQTRPSTGTQVSSLLPRPAHRQPPCSHNGVPPMQAKHPAGEVEPPQIIGCEAEQAAQ